MLSYVERMVKIWARYEHFVTMMLTNWEFPEEEDEFRFVRVMIEKIEFDF